MSQDDLARRWLRENGYEDIASMIDEIMDEWREAGNRTRRNWWDILAGDAHGGPRKVAGREFPVLMAAQRRHGVPITERHMQKGRGASASDPPDREVASEAQARAESKQASRSEYGGVALLAKALVPSAAQAPDTARS